MANSASIEVDSNDDGVRDDHYTTRLEQIRLNGDQVDSTSEDTAASLKSLPPDTIEGLIENGRRYANESYFLPNDEAEEIRSSIVHQMYLTALSGHLTYHRVKSGVTKILDIGAGPGDWSIAMAETFPDCEIVATDIWPFQPAGIPPNLSYDIDDARLPWNLTNTFDFVHLRGLAGAFQDWSHVYRQVQEACSDDATVEIADLSMLRYRVEKSNTALQRYNDALLRAAKLADISFDLDHLQPELLQDAGLTIVRQASVELPVGQWHPDPRKALLGKLALVAVLEGLEGQCLRLFTTQLNWTVKEIKHLCAEVSKEVLHANVQPVVVCRFVVARKTPI